MIISRLMQLSRSSIPGRRLRRSRAAARTPRAAVALAALALAGNGCGDVLDVDSPDIVLPDNLDTPAGLAARRNGAVGDFVVAFTGQGGAAGEDGHVQIGALLSDELKISDTQTGRTTIDARRVQERSGDAFDIFSRFHRARRAAEEAAAAYLAASEPPAGTDEAVAELLSLAGYTYIFFAEDFCAGVPFSQAREDGGIEFGSPQSTAEVFTTAAQRFEEAMTYAVRASSPGMEALARLGKGRALLGLGRYDEAAQTVATVPTDYEYLIRYSNSTERQANGLYNIINDVERMSAVNREGQNGIDYLDAFTAGDSRTPIIKDPRNGVGFDSSVEMFLQLKFPDRLSPIPLAVGLEARLIEAESALQQRGFADFERLHNALRARIELAPVSVDGMSYDRVVDWHFRERALWLWLQGHRLGDLRRLVRQYGRDPESVFPSGVYTTKPTFPSYGTAVSLPIPFEERNNPNATGCTSLAA